MVAMSDREIVQYIRQSLDDNAARAAGLATGERLPLSDVLARRITGELIPDLRQLYLDMLGVSALWQQKGFQAGLAQAMAEKKLLAGYPADVWFAWGQLFLFVLDLLGTPQEAAGGLTAIDALLADYIPMTETEWAAQQPTPTPEPA